MYIYIYTHYTESILASVKLTPYVALPSVSRQRKVKMWKLQITTTR